MYLPMNLYIDDVVIDTSLLHAGGMYYVRRDGVFHFISSEDVKLECCDLNGVVKFFNLKDFIDLELQDYDKSERQIFLFGSFAPSFVVNVDLASLCYEDGIKDLTLTRNLSVFLYYMKDTKFYVRDSWLYISDGFLESIKVRFVGDEKQFMCSVSKYKIVA